MRPGMNHRSASRILHVLAIATVSITGIAVWLGYVLVTRNAPSVAEPVLWVGAASLLLELALSGWSIRAVKAIEEEHKKDRMRFVAAAVHDVRQPLQAATLFVDGLLHSTLSPQPLKAAQCLDQSIQSVRHILDGLLDISKIDAGEVSVKNQVFSLAVLLHALEAEFAPHALSKNLRYCFYAPPTDVYVESDPQLVQMIVRNLLIQAIAQTQHGGVLLGVRQRGKRVLIQVWDTHKNEQSIPDKSSDRYRDIASRVAALIRSPLTFELKMGRGAVYTLTLPHGNSPMRPPTSGVHI